MRFYFSGISSPAEVAMLQAAGAAHILVDPHQAPLVAGWQGVERVKDNGEYARFTRGVPMPSWDDYISDADHYTDANAYAGSDVPRCAGQREHR